jgi:two-component system, chemotaxis family, CheB/CheR fusion protein
MVKGLVELHGGTVGIASEGQGRGTEVSILLPLEAAPAQLPEPSEAPATAPAARSRRVLVVDDNADTADSMRSVLELSGHSVQVAYDGPEALTLARAFRPEIILCDIGLPTMDGYMVARALRDDENMQGVFLIAVSGYTRPEDLAHATAAGFDRHLGKPANLEKLERLIREAPGLPRLLH